MEMLSKPCKDRFLHPILVHSIVKKKGSQNGAHQKNWEKNISISQFHQHFTNSLGTDIISPKNSKPNFNERKAAQAQSTFV